MSRLAWPIRSPPINCFMELLIAPESWPFTFALILVILIGMIESLSLLVGLSLSGWFDHLAVPHLDVAADSWLGWLHVGKVPFLVLLVMLLTSFAFFGFVGNVVVYGVLGVYPLPWVTSALALLVSLPVVRVCGAALARLMPKDESSAVSLDSLVGHVAVIVNGTAKKGYPAEARVKTEFGQTFYIHVEPDDAGQQFAIGDSVLLVRQIAGSKFIAIANPRPDLL